MLKYTVPARFAGLVHPALTQSIEAHKSGHHPQIRVCNGESATAKAAKPKAETVHSPYRGCCSSRSKLPMPAPCQDHQV